MYESYKVLIGCYVHDGKATLRGWFVIARCGQFKHFLFLTNLHPFYSNTRQSAHTKKAHVHIKSILWHTNDLHSFVISLGGITICYNLSCP